MKSISSRENPLYKELTLLASNGQVRRKTARTVLDGIHLCETYLVQVGLPPVCVVSESSLKFAEVLSIVEKCEAASVTCVVLPDALFKPLSQVEHGVGLVFVIDVPKLVLPESIRHSVVLLDQVQDPGNLGSILRSAAAAGIEHVFCSTGTALAWSPKVLRAGMGAHFLLKIVEGVDLEELIPHVAIPLLATSSHANKCIYEIDLTQPAAWLFGHEGQGVSEKLLALATQEVSIPHLGKVESLNVAASAAICFFEQVRQNRY